ncbi:MAG TPA: hypothetical protein VIV12_26610 [Streptosporangiaceae bacterium]
MRRFKLMVLGAVGASAIALFAGSPALAAATTTSTYSFDLVTANTAVSPDGGTMCGMTMAGDWISVTGSGTFSPAAQTIKAKGSFTHYNSSGTVMCKGTWKATGFTSFTDFGTNDQGQDGGVLSMVVTHYCKTMGMTMTGIPMTVTSIVNAPPGYTEGTTVGDFTQPTGGTVVIEPEQ